jgi:hypothetical protein
VTRDRREHGPDCPCASRQHHPDRYGPDGGMRRLPGLTDAAAPPPSSGGPVTLADVQDAAARVAADVGGPDCLIPARRLDVLRKRAAERRETHTGPWVDPERDARLSEENAPFRDMQWRDGGDAAHMDAQDWDAHERDPADWELSGDVSDMFCPACRHAAHDGRCRTRVWRPVAASQVVRSELCLCDTRGGPDVRP